MTRTRDTVHALCTRCLRAPKTLEEIPDIALAGAVLLPLAAEAVALHLQVGDAPGQCADAK